MRGARHVIEPSPPHTRILASEMKAALALALAAALAVRAQVDPALEQLISSREAQVQTLRDRAVTLFRRRCEAAQRRCDACSFDMCTTNLPSDGVRGFARSHAVASRGKGGSPGAQGVVSAAHGS